MPKDNIERAIKRASDKSVGDYKEILFEGYGPSGIAILVETATDNNTRTVANIRSYFNKHNGNLGTSGSVSFMFDHTCNFKINKENIDIENLEFDLIDYGVEEVFEEDENILIYGAFKNLNDAFSFGPKNDKEAKAFAQFFESTNDIAEFTQTWTRVKINDFN